MPGVVVAALEAGRAALSAGRWAQAREAFESALAQEKSPEAWDGLAQALHWLCEYESAITAREQAFAGFRARGQTRYPAVLAAYWLAWEYAVVYGNFAAAQGWLARGQRLAGHDPDCTEHGWVALATAIVTDDPDEKQPHVDAALTLARRFGDPDLEFTALAYAGLCEVMRGEVHSGFRLLDEALAAVTAGEVRGVAAAGEIYCKMLLACEAALDVRRAQQWLQAATSFARETNFVGVSGICRMHYGGLLTVAGQWEQAEAELGESMRIYRGGYRGLLPGAVVRLAELRARQGRFEEAEQLLSGNEHDSFAVRPRARLHLGQGEPLRAIALLRPRLGTPCADPAVAPTLLLLVEAELAAGHAGPAQAAAAALATAAERHRTVAARALSDLALGLVTNPPACHLHLGQALSGFLAAQLVPEAARARLEQARRLAHTDAHQAVVAAQSALSEFGRLGAAPEVDAAIALLRRLGVRRAAPPRHFTGPAQLSPRESEILGLLSEGLTNPEIARRLFISPKTVSHHVSSVLSKLGVRNRAEATAYALRHAKP